MLAGLYRFTARGAGGQQQGFEREELVDWASGRFDAELDLDDLKNKQREEIRARARRAQPAATTSRPTRSPPRRSSASSSCSPTPAPSRARSATSPATTASSTTWPTGSSKTLRLRSCRATSWRSSTARQLERRVSQVVEDHFRPEMRRMERALLLQILDTAWKEHLLAMDHLRSSVGLRGYAQVDPKVEYKREGMRLFEHDVDRGRRTT